MATAVKVSDELFEKAKTKSKVYKRSIAGPIEYWSKTGYLPKNSPDFINKSRSPSTVYFCAINIFAPSDQRQL
jgi:hypothetical protein